MIRPAKRRLATIGVALTLATTGLASIAVAAPAGAEAGTRTVGRGQSIQAALDTALPGERIVVRPGTYAEQLTISKNGISLVGQGAVLVPPASPVANLCSGLAGPGTEAGICVTGRHVELADFVVEHRKVVSVGHRVEDVSITGFEVRGFSGPNVALVGAQDARVTGNRLVDGAAYGALTAGSKHTSITGNIVSSSSALQFIGICMDDVAPVLVAHNDVSGYDVGLCIQTQGADVRDNEVHNTCIGAYVDPQIGARVRDNHISTTNPVCAAENAYGIFGIILAGSVGTEVRHNRIEGQTAAGAAVGLAVVDAGPAGPVASGNVVKGNTLVANDLDLLVDTAGPGNIITGNRCSTSNPAGLCG